MMNKKIMSIIAVAMLLCGNVLLPYTAQYRADICSKIINEEFDNKISIRSIEVQSLLDQENITYMELLGMLAEERRALLAQKTAQFPAEDSSEKLQERIAAIEAILMPLGEDQ
jgi:hypothetical protein